MLKRIAVEDLRLGMFVQELCGSWMDHPFWRSRIKLDDLAVLKQIQDSPVKEVVIDLSKGLDVAVPETASPAEAKPAPSTPAQLVEPKV